MSERFILSSPLDPRARLLVEELTDEYARRYGDFYDPAGEPREMDKYPPEDFAAPHGHFLLLLRDEQAVAGGAFKRLDERTAELKRVWTRSDLRRQGLAHKVVRELEAQAARQGYERIYLTTGFRQPEAVRLYLRHGYTPLFDLSVDPLLHRKLPFDKHLGQPTPTIDLSQAHPHLWQPAPWRVAATAEH